MINKTILISFCLILVSFTGFCQDYPRSIIIDTDTCVVFSLTQSKQLILWNTQKQECFDLSKILESEIDVKDSVITQKEQKILALREIEQSYQQIVVEKNDLKLICEAEKTDYKNAIKRHKRQKWLSIGVGVLSTSLMTYLFITK